MKAVKNTTTNAETAKEQEQAPRTPLTKFDQLILQKLI